MSDTQPVEVAEGKTAEVSFKLARPLITGESAEIVARVRRNCQSSSHRATEGFDFATTRPQTLAFSRDNQTVTVSIPTIQDDVDEEPRECFKVEIAQSEAIGIDLSPESTFPVEVFVLDDDDPPTFVFSQAEVLEPDDPINSRDSDTALLRFGVALNRPSERTVTVEYSQGTGVGDDQATSGTDYEAIIPGTLTFRPGEVLKHITVTVKGDYDEEPDEKVWVNLSNPVNVCFPGSGSCETSDRPIWGTIKNEDDNIKISFTLKDDKVPEGEDAELMISLSRALGSSKNWRGHGLSLRFYIQDLGQGTTGGGTALLDSDYRLPSGVQTDSDGEKYFEISFDRVSGTEKSVKLPTIKDDVDGEGVETVNFRIKRVGLWILGTGLIVIESRNPDRYKELFGSRHLPAQINEDITTPVLHILDGPVLSVRAVKEKVTEGGVADFVVTLNEPVADDVTFSWKTVDGGEGVSAARTARAGADYVSQSSQQVTIPAGETRVALQVTTLQDTVDEWDQKFSVVLESPTGATLDEPRAMMIIRDDDARPTMSITDEQEDEGETLFFDVTLSAASEKEITVGWHTEDGTATVADYDYVRAQRQSLTFAPGEVKRTIALGTITDHRNEADEQFRVELFHAPEAVFADPTGQGTILNDDPLEISISDASLVAENATDATATFTVTMSTPQSQAVTIKWRTENGIGGDNDIAKGDGTTLRGTKDFQSVPATDLTFAAGETTKTVSVTVLDDLVPEVEENFRVVLEKSDNTELIFRRSTAFGTIGDNDSERIWIDQPSSFVITEGDSADGRNDVNVTVRRTQLSPYSVWRFIVCLIAEGEHAGTATLPRPSTQTVPGSKIDAYLRSSSYFSSQLCHIRLETNEVVYKNFRPGQNEFTFRIGTLGDDDPEENETFTVWIQLAGADPTVTSPEYYGGLIQTFTVLDDDQPQATIANATVEESSGKVDLTIELDKQATEDQVIYLVAQDGTAKAGQDYVYTNPITVPIKKGDKGAIEASISIPIIHDAIKEGAETFTVSLLEDHPDTDTDEARSSKLNVHPVDGTATVTIRDSRSSLLLTPPDMAVSEGDTAQIHFELTRQAAILGGYTLKWAPTIQGVSQPATPGADYESQDRTLHFRSGHGVFHLSSRSDVELPTKENTKPEPDRNVGIEVKPTAGEDLRYEGYTASQTSGHLPLVIIRDDDPGSLKIEGLKNAKVEENTAWKSAKPTVSGHFVGHVTWTMEGDDVSLFSISLDTGELSLPAQNFEQPADKDKNNTYQVTVRATDEDGNTDTQNVTVTVENVTTHFFVLGKMTSSVNEGEDTLINMIPGKSLLNLNYTLDRVVRMKWVTLPDETGTHPAGSDDYSVTNDGSISFLPGKVSSTSFRFIRVKTSEDDLNEPPETFLVELSGPDDDVEFHFLNDDRTVSTYKTTVQFTVTIKDNDEVTLSVADATVVEGDKAQVVASLDRASYKDETFKWKTTADAGKDAIPATSADYTEVALTDVTIKAGETEVTLEVQTTEDTLDEEDETFLVTLQDPSVKSPTPNRSAVVTITDDDPAPSVSVGDAAAKVSEGDDPKVTSDMSFTVSLSAISGKDVTVTYSLGGTATGGSDYTTPNPLTVTIPAGSQTGSITVPVKGDVVEELDETVEVTLTKATNATLSTTAADLVGSGTITDDDTVVVSVNDATVTEGGKAEFTVVLSTSSDRAVTVKWVTAVDADEDAVPATAGVDYTAVTTAQTLTVAAGATKGVLEVQTTKDTLDEEDETFLVVLSSPSNAALADDPNAKGTITDDDDPPSVSVGDAAAKVSEGDDPKVTSDMSFTVSLSEVSGKDVTVTYSLGGTASAGSDYTAPDPLSVTIPAGKSSGSITVPVKGDVVDELNETVEVTLTKATNATLSSVQGATVGEGTITDDDAVVVSVGDVTVTEGGKAEFTVALSTPSDRAVTVKWLTTVDADEDAVPATAGVDYTAVSPAQTLTVAAGATKGVLEVQTTKDTLDEEDETFLVVLLSVSNAVLADGITVKATITDDDPAPTVSVGDAAAVTEGDDPETTSDMTFTVTLSAVSGKPVTVTYSLGGSATVGSDYTAPNSLSVTIPAGSQTGSIVVAVKGDTVDELNETVEVTLTGATNASVSTVEGADEGSGTITDDDATPTGASLSVDPGSVAEDATEAATVTVTATLSGTTTFSTAKTVTVTVGDKDDTAKSGTDYTAVNPFTVTIAAGSSSGSASFDLDPTDDSLDEPTESVSVAGSAGGLTVSSSSVSITDDDAAPTVSVGDAAAVSEGDDPETTSDMTFTVTLSAVSGKPVTVTYSLGGSATAGSDYTAPSPLSVSIPAGEASGSIVIPVKGDTVDEANEKIEVTLTEATNATLSSVSGATVGEGTITDDDATPTAASLSVTPTTVSEGASEAATVTVTARLSGSTTFSVDKTVSVSVGKASDSAKSGTDYAAVAPFTVNCGGC